MSEPMEGNQRNRRTRTTECPPSKKDDITFQDWERYIYKAAHNYHKKTGIDIVECIDEGMYSFVLAYRAWEPSRGPFKTYLAGTMAKQFITRLKKENKHFFYDLVKINDELLFSSLTADEKYDFEGHLFSFNPNLLSEEAKQVLRLIFSIGDDLRYISKNQIEKYLQKTMKWTRFHIQKTFKEIEENLTE